MRYIALLRAVNVGGRQVKMDRLRALFEEMRFRNVETFIASGNVIFEATGKAVSIESKIEKHLLESLGFEVPTLVRSTDAFSAAAARTPFLALPPLTKAGGLYVGFLKSDAASDGLAKLEPYSGGGNTFALHGRELYWRAEDRQAGIAIPIAKFERAVGCPATFRNITTVQKIVERYCG